MLALSALIAVDLMIAISASLYSGPSAAGLVVLFFGVMALTVWQRWNAALLALHTLTIAGLLLRGVAITGGEVFPSVLRSFVLLAGVDSLVYAVIRLRPPG